ncbi:MAG: GspE/PulE family protein [Candidatus Velthaea sp.]|jgi:type IV pilus assembly protein PilB
MPSSSTTHAVDEAATRVPRALAFRLDALPLEWHNGVLTVGLADPGAAEVLDELRSATRLAIRPVQLARSAIRERLRIVYGELEAPKSRDDGSTISAVDRLFARAAGAHASDVHIEPVGRGGRIRFRIDGLLQEIERVSPEAYAPLVSRVKLLAGIDIAEKRVPQDGRYTIRIEQREIDARVSSVAAADGEKLVVRLLDRRAHLPELARLGMAPSMRVQYQRLARAPWGFLVVAGPTGSGKTTTLYASLSELDSARLNVCSVEDPIEMQLAGVTQVQVNAKAGVTFAVSLRAFMRQDPNVVMIGEMRDGETAAVAVSAALAGQLVFTTLHANDAPRTIERLVDLGVPRHALAAGLSAVVAQRLVRTLCTACRRSAPIPTAYRAFAPDADRHWFEAVGCRVCANTGFLGRTAVYELLEVDDILREAIVAGSSSSALARLGTQSGYVPMFADGLHKVSSGLTSFDELTRVVAPGGAT